MATSVTEHHIFGTKDVASAGTAVQLEETSRPVVSLLIIAHSDNTGRIFYGGSDVDSSTQKGLEGGESVTIPAPLRGASMGSFDITDYFIDAATSGDGVDFVAVRLV